MTELEIAERIAREAHAGQKEESTGDDYIRHVERVVALVDGDGAKVVAWLHDVLEDNPEVTWAHLTAWGIAPVHVRAVRLLTRTAPYDYETYIAQIQSGGDSLAVAVKLADLKDHLRPNCPARLRGRYEKAMLVLGGDQNVRGEWFTPTDLRRSGQDWDDGVGVGPAEGRIAALQAEIAEAMAVLAPNMRESGLVDACKQVKQVAIGEADNSEVLDATVARLQAAIRAHRDARGDDRCWLDDEALYQVLPEGYTPPARDTAVELENCRRYIASRHHPGTSYVSPETELERLRFWLRRLVRECVEHNREYHHHTPETVLAEVQALVGKDL